MSRQLLGDAFAIFLASCIAASILGLIILAVYIKTNVWYECRSVGHSFFYCLQLINH